MATLTPAVTATGSAVASPVELVPLLCSDVDPLLCSDLLCCTDADGMSAAATSTGTLVAS